MVTGTPIRLSELSSKIQFAISSVFKNTHYWIIADVTNHTFKSAQGYHYFELVEKDSHTNGIIARISGKAWGNGSQNILNFERATGQKFTNNINVLINVSVDYHATFGLQINLNDIDIHFTLGLLEQQKQETLKRLVSENPEFIEKIGGKYVTRNNSLVINLVIQRIALISSKSSAGAEDFKHTLFNNTFGYRFLIDDYFTLVQGDNNSDHLFNAIIQAFNANSTRNYDAIVIIRGGGAQSDFILFDNYKIGRTVAKCPIPIITGIGHQKNETVCDLMAHTSTKTPTKSAEFIIAHNRSFEDMLTAYQKNIIIKSQQLLSQSFQQLTRMNNLLSGSSRNIMTRQKDQLVETNQIIINESKSIIFHNKNSLTILSSQLISKPKITLYNRLNDVCNIFNNIKTFNAQYLKNKKGYIGHYISVINLMAPDNILKKGFAIIKVNNEVTSAPDSIKIGSEIDIILSDIKITSIVKQKQRYNGSDFNL